MTWRFLKRQTKKKLLTQPTYQTRTNGHLCNNKLPMLKKSTPCLTKRAKKWKINIYFLKI
uniref:Uncharacterized protein n=1 Tax=Romanomermis culicivorax TaxID=13658 RepID=A0A915I3V4_ROMCU